MSDDDEPAPTDPAGRAARDRRYREAHAEGIRAARANYRASPEGHAAHAAGKSRSRRAKSDAKPFIGLDGEGAGTDDKGRQNYMLMRAGGRELYTGKPLTTPECLDFILGCPAPSDAILAGFAFGYDVTMILRDLSQERRGHLFTDKSTGPGRSRYTYWRGYGIEYLPKNYLRVCRTRVVERFREDGTAFFGRERIKGSARTVYETFGFFQQSFLSAIISFDVGAEHWETIAAMKAARSEFTGMTDAVRRYCAIECDLLAAMMEKFRTVCLAAGLRPRTWNGAGKLAGALHTSHETMTTVAAHAAVPQGGVWDHARDAYYGGRFEVSTIGEVPGPVYEYDLRSAYPAMMLKLPCLLHGSWHPMTPGDVTSAGADDLFVAGVRFRHREMINPADDQMPLYRTLCGLPVRQQSGRLFWPMQGNGVYWSPEIRAAQRLGAMITVPVDHDRICGWRYERHCECRPFDWVAALFAYRQTLPTLQGIPIKLAINSLYGRLAQRIGNPRWANLIWAGLITAMTRAALIDAALSSGPGGRGVVMLATDGVYSTNPLTVTEGGGLGQWETAVHDRLFVVQPGLYWPLSNPPLPPAEALKRPKSRGVSSSYFADKTGWFEQQWADYAERAQAAGTGGYVEPPVVSLPMTLFIGLKLAQARGKPNLAGVWADTTRHFRFAWAGRKIHDGKRAGRGVWTGDRTLWTYPPPGAPNLYSKPHMSDPDVQAKFDIDRAELEEQRDWIDLNPPWTGAE